MKYIFFLTATLLAGLAAGAQDYIITWQGDSIACRFPDKPRKEGFRPAGKYHNGHIRVATIFPNDSVRVIEAGQIKGYYRAKHGKSLLCNGQFVTKKLVDHAGRKDAWWNNTTEAEPFFFVQKVIEGKHADLYTFYVQFGSDAPEQYYCITKHNETEAGKAIVMNNRKKAVQFLSDPDIAEDMSQFRYKKNWKAYHQIVEEYNRLKTEVAGNRN